MKNKQTGPITPYGKEISSRNAIKHGGTSPRLINEEERNRYEVLVEDLKKEYKSSNPLVQLQITRIARITIQLERIQDVTDASFRKSHMRANTVANLLDSTDKYNIQLNGIAGDLFEIHEFDGDKKARSIAEELLQVKQIDGILFWEDFTQNLPAMTDFVCKKARGKGLSIRDFLLEEMASLPNSFCEQSRQISLNEDRQKAFTNPSKMEKISKETQLSLLKLYASWYQFVLREYFDSHEMNFTIEDTIKIEEEAMLPSAQEMDRLMRYQTTLQRQLSAALGELLAINRRNNNSV